MLRHIPNFIDTERANIMLNVLEACVPWTTFALSPNSRKVCLWKGDGSEVDGLVRGIAKQLEVAEGVQVQGIFLNLYQDGSDHCPYHRDQYGCDVYTLSLGATRDLLVKHDGDRAQKVTLRSGDLYFMAAELHKDHKHSIPKRAGVSQPRISIVFFTKKYHI